jgi:hypothetical protein
MKTDVMLLLVGDGKAGSETWTLDTSLEIIPWSEFSYGAHLSMFYLFSPEVLSWLSYITGCASLFGNMMYYESYVASATHVLEGGEECMKMELAKMYSNYDFYSCGISLSGVPTNNLFHSQNT